MSSFPQLNSAAGKILILIDNCKTPTQLHQIQAQLILHNLYSNTTIAHHFITCCQTLGLLNSAFHLYTQFKKPHVFICNTLIKAFSHSKFPQNSIFLYTHMHKNSIIPNNYTFPFVLKSLSDLKDLVKGKCIHTQITKLGHLNDIYVQNSLLNLYASCDKMVLCEKLFDEMLQRDVVSWTVMITGFKEAGKFDHALIAFEQMQYSGVVPNQVTMVNALSACASFGAVEMGVWIHDFIKRSGWELDVILGTSLIDMYGKSGRIEEGLRVFESMVEKNVFTWNAIIKGLALAKSGEQAIWWFSRMEQTGVKPDGVTMIAVFRRCFKSHTKNAIRANYMSIWGALLAGCRTHGSVELSELAAWRLVELAPENSAYYVVLSNFYAGMGRWNDVEKVQMLMKDGELKKDLGASSVELEPQILHHELLT